MSSYYAPSVFIRFNGKANLWGCCIYGVVLAKLMTSVYSLNFRTCKYHGLTGVYVPIDDNAHEMGICLIAMLEPKSFQDAQNYCRSNDFGMLFEPRTTTMESISSEFIHAQVQAPSWVGIKWDRLKKSWIWLSDNSLVYHPPWPPETVPVVTSSHDEYCIRRSHDPDKEHANLEDSWKVTACSGRERFVCSVTACEPNSFRTGQSCSTCHCADNSLCDSLDGLCPDGCAIGYTGAICQNTICPPLKFGAPNCASVCRCKDGVQCNPKTGMCPSGCDPDWTGPTCNQTVCPQGYWGPPACSDTCHCLDDTACKPSTGDCPYFECQGTWAGDKCRGAICPGGYFHPPRCQKQCNCRDNTNMNCDPYTGHCMKGCDETHKGQNCQEKICPPDKYNPPDCDKACHCADPNDCNPLTGNCDKTCAVGWVRSTSSKCDVRACASQRWSIPSCDKECYCANGDCDVISGECLGPCKPGYYGAYCGKSSVLLDEGTTDVSAAIIILFFMFAFLVVVALCVLPSAPKRKKPTTVWVVPSKSSSSSESLDDAPRDKLIESLRVALTKQKNSGDELAKQGQSE